MPVFRMTNNVFKNLFRAPVTECYPKVQKVYPKGARGKVDIDISKCIFCGICQRKCPTNAITVDKAGKSWAIERMGCVSCGYCVDVCPKKCLFLDVQYSPCAATTVKETFVLPLKESLPPA